MKKATKWCYKFPGIFYVYGPTTEKYTTEKEVREMLRRSWGFKRLPANTEIWRALDA